MADDDVAAAGFSKHGRGNFTSEGAFLAPGDVLAGDGDAGAFRSFDGGREIAVNGGATTMSQCFAAATSGRNEEKNARVSASVLYIFQLPAITRRRI